MRAAKSMTVGYVDAEGKTKEATITDVHSDTSVMLDHASKADRDKGQSHTAQAEFNADKKSPNTFHFLSEGNGAGPSRTGGKQTAAASKE